MIVLAYRGWSELLVGLSCLAIISAWLLPNRTARPRLLDFALLLAVLYEFPSLLLSRYPPNGVASAETVCAATLLYLTVRLSNPPAHYMAVVAALAAAGGLYLSWAAVTQFNGHYRALQANGFNDVVAFRYRLIAPPPPWVSGEWFTLVLLTLPFAVAAVVFLWLSHRRGLAAIAMLLPLAISAALVLSCLRAVFWALAVFVSAFLAACVLYWILSLRGAAVATICMLFAMAGLLVAVNLLCPGIVRAYTAREVSQTRSTEGRLTIWKRSADVFKVSPLWGVGSGNAPLLLSAGSDEDQTTGFASRTFSLPIQVLTEKGIIGAALYLAVPVLAGREAHRKLRSPTVSQQMKGITCCMAAGIVGVLFREITYCSLLEHSATAMLFAMMLAFLAAEELV